MKIKILFVFILLGLLICLAAPAFAQDNSNLTITGYYYDPDSGSIIPQYNNLSPDGSTYVAPVIPTPTPPAQGGGNPNSNNAGGNSNNAGGNSGGNQGGGNSGNAPGQNKKK